MEINNSLSTQISLNQQGLGITGKSPLKPEEMPQEGAGAGEVLGSFGTLLQTQMNHISRLENTANQAVETYAIGGDIELHNVILAVEKADMAMQLAMQIRNRIVSAYQEVSRMQV